MDAVALAYCAGIIDGEGFIGINRSKPGKIRVTPGFAIRIQVRMVESGAIDYLAKTLGGWYYVETRPQLNRRPLFCWSISCAAAEKAIRLVLPYLKVKARQASLALSLRAHQSQASKNRTKATGRKRNFPAHGRDRQVDIKVLSDEFVMRCEQLYLECKAANRVGVVR